MGIAPYPASKESVLHHRILLNARNITGKQAQGLRNAMLVPIFGNTGILIFGLLIVLVAGIHGCNLGERFLDMKQGDVF
ncbi:MAG TPA: hypothetical protein VNQ76_21620 [Planctomicrobium sp.]|nr:hypothetical protein [Planctomicrobium sp.]